MALIDELTDFMAKQLSDHDTQQSGVDQPTYFAWTKPHYLEALTLAGSHLFSLMPDIYASTHCVNFPEETCLVDLKGEDGKVLTLLAVNGACNILNERKPPAASLLNLLSPRCAPEMVDDMGKLQYNRIAPGIYQFEKPLPPSTSITYLRSVYTNIQSVDDNIIREYRTFLVNFALWQMLLIDNESRSNQTRWESYYQSMVNFVSEKMKTEFDLSVDTSIYHTSLPPD